MKTINYFLIAGAITGAAAGGFYAGRHSIQTGIVETNGSVTIGIQEKRLVEKYGGEEMVRGMLKTKLLGIHSELLVPELWREIYKINSEAADKKIKLLKEKGFLEDYLKKRVSPLEHLFDEKDRI